MSSIAPTGDPFEAPGGPHAALLLHGLTSTPFELRPVAEGLAEDGLRVSAPRLIGHGKRPELLRHTRWHDWLSAARRAADRLLKDHERIFVVGLSMGGLLAAKLAHERGARVSGLVMMSVPLELKWSTQLFLRIAERLPLAEAVPYLRKESGPDVSDPAIAASMPGHDVIPLAAAVSLLDGQRVVADRIGRLSIPVLVQHGRHDHTAPVLNAHQIMRKLRTPSRRMIIYPDSWHILPLDVEHAAVLEDVRAFVRDPVVFCGGLKA